MVLDGHSRKQICVEVKCTISSRYDQNTQENDKDIAEDGFQGARLRPLVRKSTAATSECVSLKR